MSRASSNQIFVGSTGFGATEISQTGNYSLTNVNYGSGSDSTIIYKGTGGHTFTHVNSASLSVGEYVWVENRGTGNVDVVFTNGSDTIGAASLAVTNLLVLPGERVRFAVTQDINIWTVS